ncbi:ABC transporter ATP-binding protein [Acidithiobacillus montserratensis]|uniref:ABC transporter ATP-binding protein n=1 Tax=Acidithiobacillus montserratensis TaxID=2729135 RepID=A0ACD5HBZ8_9PROT|nr:ABC transporter ATP-binding protein [Acidithiobacillus montserratensis]
MSTPGAPAALSSRSFQRLLALVRPYRGRIAIAMLFMVISAAAMGAMAYIIKPVLDQIFIQHRANMLVWLPLGVILIYAVKGAADYLQAINLARVEEEVLRGLREKLFAHTLRLPLEVLIDHSHGSTLSRMSLDLTLLQQGLSVLARFFLSTFQIVGLLFVVFYMSWQLALISLITLPIAFYPLIRFGQKLRHRGNTQQEQMGEIMDQFSQSLRGVEVIKSQGGEPFEANRFARQAQHYFILMMQIARIQKATVPVMEMIAALGIAAIIYLGGSQVVNGNMSTGAFFSFFTALGLIYEPLRQLSSANNQLQQGLSAADRLFAWLDQPAEHTETSPSPQPWGTWQCHDLRLQLGVEQILQGLDISIPPQSTTAIVGPSGSGKTSLVRVILGLLPASAGSISVAGVDKSRIPDGDYRRYFSFVAQEPVLFTGSVLSNIAYGESQPDRQRAETAARQAHAWDFLARSGGLDSMIQGNGANFSGGQRQRLAIARALYLDRPVLVLDEATSNLDSESEERIAETLAELHGQKTILIVAHRPRTTRLADQVIRLERGKRLQG